jgi:hypothetical protein
MSWSRFRVSKILKILTIIKMAKEIKGLIKLQIDAGKANPAPPVGPALGQY